MNQEEYEKYRLTLQNKSLAKEGIGRLNPNDHNPYETNEEYEKFLKKYEKLVQEDEE